MVQSACDGSFSRRALKVEKKFLASTLGMEAVF